MKKICFVFVLLLTLSAAYAGNIITVAGDGTFGYGGDGGAATAAWLNSPDGLALDAAGNLYIADQSNHRIRKLSTSGIITTIAGTGISGFSGDGGPATAARLNNPTAVAADAAGNIYISDYGNSRIRMISSSGIITTIAGTGTASFSGDGGPATAATFNSLAGIAVRNSDVYIADKGNNRIRKITSGIITTVAGTTVGFSGDYGLATAARLNQPNAVALDDNGNLYIADLDNFRIRKVDTFGTITTIGGSGSAGYYGDGGPATAAGMTQPFAVATDRAGNVYVTFGYNNRVRRITPSGLITTVIGTGAPGFSGDGGPATAADIKYPKGLAIDGIGNTYISDNLNGRIRYVEMNSRPVLTGGHTGRLHVCQNAVAVGYDSLAAARDADAGQTLSWSVGRTPLHGSVAGTYSTVATGATVTPSGLSYTPAYGYYGADTFSVKVTDGITFDSALIFVNVVRLPIGGYIMGADSICPSGHQTFADTSGTPGGRWTHTDTFIVLDTVTGYMTGISPGTENVIYTVTNSCGTATASLRVTVNAAPLSGAIVGADSVCVGASITLTNPTATPGGDWESGDTTIARISAAGVVTGVAGGIVYISYNAYTHCGSAPAYHRLVVSPNPGIITGPDSLCPGGTITLANATAGGVWTSGATAVATINTTGRVYGVTPGSATISYTVTTVSCGTGRAFRNVTVVAPPAAGSISGPSSVCSGSTITLSASVAGGHWYAADTSLASVDSVTGIVTGRAPGSVNISYSVVNFCGTATTIRTVAVNGPPAVPGITAADSVCTGASATVTSSASGGTWSLTNANAGLSSASAASPVLSGVSVGRDTLVYTLTNVCGTAVARHYFKVVTLPQHGAIAGATSVCQFATTSFTDTAFGGVWSSSAPAIATIATSGLLTGRSGGTAIISYNITNACGAVADTHTVQVVPLPVVTFSGPSVVCAGGTATIAALPTGGSWGATGSNISVAAGVVTGINAGTDSVFYIAANSCGSDTGYYPVTILGMPVVADVSGPRVLCSGAAATYTDSTVGGSWSSSAVAVATISASGAVTALTTGTVILSYSVSNSCFTAADTLQLHIITLPAPATLSGPSVVCMADSITITAVPTGGSWTTTFSFAHVAGGLVTGMYAGRDTIRYSLTNSCGTTVTRHAVSVLPLPAPGVIAGPSVVCPGSVITLTDTPAGGTWSVALTFATVSGGIVTGVTPGTDTVLYTVANSCGTAVARKIVTVAPFTSPAVTAVATPDTIVCAGDVVTLTAYATSGGTAPYIQWVRSGTIAGTGPVFSTHPAAGDVFWCRLVSSDACALRDTVNSNVLTITVNPVITPSVLLTVSPNDTVAYAGQVLVFTAHATNCGGVPVYTWFVNGTLVAGATDSVYSRPVLANDTVYCVVTCSAPCTATPYNRTNTIVANGTPLGFADPVAGGASFFIYPNPNSGSFLLSGIYEGGTLCYIVTDMTGRQISTGALFTESGALNQKISLDGVEPGMYILDIITRYSRIRLVCNIVYMQ